MFLQKDSISREILRFVTASLKQRFYYFWTDLFENVSLPEVL